MSEFVPITAIIPTTGDRETLFEVLSNIHSCVPKPMEIMVYLDNSDCEIDDLLLTQFPNVVLITGSSPNKGPGGSRNELIRMAKFELVANFDDDSWPEDTDFFARVMLSSTRFPNAAILSAASMISEKNLHLPQQIAAPSGCGCVFRKSWFEKLQGFVPLAIAYNMEEVDIGIQILAIKGMVILDPSLRVHHHQDPNRPISSILNAHVLANTALLPFLRFPIWLLPIGILQWFRRIIICIKLGLRAGLLNGICLSVGHLWQYRSYRHPVSSHDVFNWLELRRHPRPLTGLKPNTCQPT